MFMSKGKCDVQQPVYQINDCIVNLVMIYIDRDLGRRSVRQHIIPRLKGWNPKAAVDINVVNS